MSPSKQVSVQEFLEHLNSIKDAGDGDNVNSVLDRMKRLGVYDLLFAAEEKYKEFWDCLGIVKVVEMLEQLDRDSSEINLSEGSQVFSLESNPYLNQQPNEIKAFAAWHLHNIQSGNDSVFTADYLRTMAEQANR